jgi:putative transposase
MSGSPHHEPAPIWQKRFYDFNVWTKEKQTEKLRYMHRNPVKRGLVENPEQWEWSSFRSYLFGETGPVRVKFQEWPIGESFGDRRVVGITEARSGRSAASY